MRLKRLRVTEREQQSAEKMMDCVLGRVRGLFESSALRVSSVSVDSLTSLLAAGVALRARVSRRHE